MTNLKAVALATGFVALLAFQNHQQRKTYKVEQSLDFWIQASNGLEFTKNNLKISDLPSKTVTLINDSLISPLQMEISKQVNEQLKLDTLNKKR